MFTWAADRQASGASKVKQSQSLELRDVSHMFGTTPAVEHVSLSLRAGELVALLGPSGCGKSTLLRIVAGFIQQTSGQVLFDGKSVDHLPANRRGVGIVFQNYALFPHLSVSENIAYGLEAQGMAKQTRSGVCARCWSSAAWTSLRSGCRASSPAASSSVLRWRARSRSRRTSCCSTSRSLRSTRTCGSTCRSRSRSCRSSPA